VARLAPRLITTLALSYFLGSTSGCESQGSGGDADGSGTGSDTGSETNGSGTDGGGTGSSSTDGSGTDGSSTDGSGTDGSSTDDSSTGNDSTNTGAAPEDILACGLATPCGDQPIEASVTGAWTGNDYVDEYRCVIETLLQTVQDGATPTPGLLRLGTNLYGDSPTNDDVAVGYEDGTATYFAHGYENGVGSWEDPHRSCALLQEAEYQACLDSPTIDCVGVDSLLGACHDVAPACP
jgi:hypothetical protein